jgi:hypothetical protein
MERFTESDADMKKTVCSLVEDWGQWTSAPLTSQMRDFFLEAMKQAKYPPPSPFRPRLGRRWMACVSQAQPEVFPQFEHL